jgi:hypothetical protein
LEKSQVSGLISTLEKLPGHDEALDLIRALVDLGDLGTLDGLPGLPG